MKLSKERKIVVGVLVLALGAMFIDRVVIGSDVTEPKQAEAVEAQAGVEPGDSPAATGAFDGGSQARERGPSISDRLSAVTQSHGLAQDDVRDAFVPSKAWADELGLGQGGTGQAPFQDRHQLMAVVTIDQDRYVIIDDQTLGLGHTLDGYTLVDVNERTAVLEANGHRVELDIPSGQ